MSRLSRAALAAGCILGAALGAEASAQTIPPGPPIRITAVTQPGPALPQYTRVDQPLLRDALQQRSGGRIEVRLASWPEMSLGGPEIIRVVRSGQAEIGAAPLTTVSGDVPFLDGIDLAGLNPDIAQARRVAQALLPAANRELERFNTRILAIYPFPAQVLWCRTAIAGLSDLRGKRVRTFGASLNDLMEAVGAQPVSIGFPEVYGALERGVVDCAVTGTGSGNGVRWYEVTSHLYTLSVGWAVAAYYVNVQWLNRLEPAVRELLLAVMREVDEAQWQLGAAATQDGIDCNIGNRAGCRIHTLVATRPMTAVAATPADQEALRRIVAERIVPGFVRRCGARCGEVYNQSVAPITGVRYAGN
jgi:TRAP-type C4-dicarboxylate transport system substrate-binding protein